MRQVQHRAWGLGPHRRRSAVVSAQVPWVWRAPTPACLTVATKPVKNTFDPTARGFFYSTLLGCLWASFVSKSNGAAAALASVGVAQGQVKTDGLWRGTAGASLALNSSTTGSQTLAANVEFVNATALDKSTLGGSANYGDAKVGNTKYKTANKWAGADQYEINIGPQPYRFGRLGLEGDELIDLNLRSSLTSGLGYKVIDHKDMNLTMLGGLGCSSDQHNIDKTIGGKTGKNFSRASLIFREETWHQLPGNNSFKQRLELDTGFTGDKALIARFTTRLGMASTKTLNVSVSLTHNYNSKAAAGIKRWEAFLWTGINVSLGAD